LEKDPSRAIDARTKALIASNAFNAWLQDQESKHQIAYNLTTDEQAWVNYQLAKLNH
jgi:hypothetical protein